MEPSEKTANEESHNHIKEIKRHGNPNFCYFEKLLDAELAAWKGQREAAKKHYETSIFLVARMGLFNQHALANERFADYMAERGDTNEAEYRCKNAISLHRNGGPKPRSNSYRKTRVA